jgi:hypothetical protein
MSVTVSLHLDVAETAGEHPVALVEAAAVEQLDDQLQVGAVEDKPACRPC